MPHVRHFDNDNERGHLRQMKRFLSLLLFATLLGGTCHNPNNIASDTCTLGSTMCRGDRPYACADGYWRPVGDSMCAPLGGMCCMTHSHVHACVNQSRCSGEAK